MQIITDSAADLTPEEIRTWGIKVVPLFIQFPNEEVSAAEITPDDFYNRLKAMVPQIPTTTQPSIGMFLDAYKADLDTGQDILSIHISSGLSGTVNTAQTAAEQTNERTGKKSVTVVDTMTLSCGERFQVLAAAMGLKAGWALDKILERLTAIRAASAVGYTLETLEYLARGGRIGRVQALAGSVLKIKPVITVEKADGKYSTIGKARTLQQTMTLLADHFVATHGSQKPVWVTVVHGQLADKADVFGAMLRERMNVARLDTLRISPVLGVHTGPGIVGGGVIPMELVQDLEA